MRRLFGKILLSCSLVSFFMSAALYIAPLHDSLKETLGSFLSTQLGYKVTIGSIRGILPFYATFENVEIQEIAEIQEVIAIPSWPDIFIGRIGLLYLGIERGQLLSGENSTATLPKEPLFNLLPSAKIAIHSFSCNLNDLSLRGQFYWRPKRQSLSIKAASTAPYKSFSHIDINAHVSKNALDANISAGFVPTDILKSTEITTRFLSNHPEVIQYFVEPLQNEIQLPYLQGSISLAGDIDKAGLTSCSIDFDINPEKVLLFRSKLLENSTLNLKGEFHGATSLEKEKKRLAIDLSSLSIASQQFKNLTFAAEWQKKDKEFVGDLALHGTRNNLPLTFLSHFETDFTNRFLFKNSELSLESAALKGSVSGTIDPFLLKGKINGSSRSLNLVSYLLKRNIHGKSRYEIRFTPNENDLTQLIEADCELKDLVSTRSNFEKINLSMTARGRFPDFSCHLVGRVKKGQFKHLEVDSAAIIASTELNDPDHKTAFEIDSKGKIDKGAFNVQVAGEAGLKRLAIGTFDLSLAGKRARLQTPFELTESLLTPIKVRWNDGANLEISADCEKEHLSGKLLIQRAPLDFVHFFFPTFFATGTLSGEGVLFGTKLDPRLHLQLSSNSLFFANKTYDTEVPIELSCQVDVQDLEASVRAECSTPKVDTPLKLRLNLPLEVIEFPYSLSFNKYQVARGDLKGKIDIAPILSPLFSENETIEGQIELDTHLTGTLLNPNFFGLISLQKGKFDYHLLGARFSDINLEARVQNHTLNIVSCTANDEKSGTLKASGQFEMESSKNFPYSFSLLTNNYEIVKKDYATVQADLKATLAGNATSGSLSGDAVITNAELDIGSSFSTGLQPLEFRYLNDVEEFETKASSAPYGFDLDLFIKLPKEKGRIYGRGVESLWHGEAELSGEVNALETHGAIDASKGTFHFAGKEFQIMNSSVAFDGDTFTQSRLNVSAVRDLASIRATIFLRGSIMQPRFVFQSKPELPQKEVLSYILFSKPLSDVSAMEGVMLANAALTLKGSKTPFSLFDTFKDSLGIDHINISKSDTGAEDPSYSLQVGKYLSDKLLLRLSKDVATAANRVAVQAHVSKNLSVQAEVGDDQEGQMSVMWKHDY